MYSFMTVLSLILAGSLGSILVPEEVATALHAPGIAGDWNGALEVGGTRLRLVLHLRSQPDGKLTGTLDSIDQSANGLLLENVRLEAGKLSLEMRIAAASFQGELNAAGTEISGTWKQGGAELPLRLTRGALELRRPQEPVKPYPYEEREVTYDSLAPGVRMAGTLTVPPNARKAPALLLVQGSGNHNRDEQVFGHRPFLVLADYLTRKGFVVLRADKRGVGKSTGVFATATTADFADDALGAVQFLKRQPEIDPARIGILGHSEGGTVGPIAAARSKDVAFLVLMAGMGLSGEEILFRQAELMLKVAGAAEEAVRRERAVQTMVFKVVKQEKDASAAEKRLRKEFQNLTPEEKQAIGGDAGVQSQIQIVNSPWFRSLLTLDPAPYLRKVKCPVLALNGSKDLQVPAKEDLEAIGRALKEAGNPDYTLKELPGLNHLFQHCTTGLPAEYQSIEETIAPEALTAIAEWLESHTRSTGRNSKKAGKQ